MSEWVSVCRLDEIPPLGSRVYRREQGDIAIFRTANDQVFALRDQCPHRGGPLSQGIVHGTRVTCPLHNWVIGLDDGKAVAPDEGCAHRYDIKLEGDQVYLHVTD